MLTKSAKVFLDCFEIHAFKRRLKYRLRIYITGINIINASKFYVVTVLQVNFTQKNLLCEKYLGCIEEIEKDDFKL